MRIGIDTKGGDKGIDEIIKGTFEAYNIQRFTPVFLGDTEKIKLKIDEFKYKFDDIDIIEAPEVITNEDDPTLAIRRKKNSTIVVGANLLSDNKIDALISSGSTGALLASSIFIVKRIEGIERTALSVFLPTAIGKTLLLDAGANMDCKPSYFLDFAIMGSIYLNKVLGINNPKVGLLNVGTEEGKGNKQSKEAFDILSKSNLNFIGNVEARDLISGVADVIVCDGFAGNIALKSFEGVAISLIRQMKSVFNNNLKTKISGLLVKSSLKEMLKQYDYRETGGAPLLGVKKPIFKAHGSSDALAYKNAIFQTIKFTENNVISEIEKKLAEGNINE